ncbi:MAG: radical SAM protein [Deltaproteobacteria bacterium]|nr:radical SAM protein [Deltaproteobacteria bacterium]
MLILSVEGFQKETDARRGPGTFARVMAAMDLLRQARIPFGYSVTVTRANEPVIASPEFLDFMIARGALMGWMFLCMPVGGNPDPNLLPTPEQRVHMLEFVQWAREHRPIFLVDFWNDAPYAGGCIAGKYYAHITPQGWVEPCVFTHFCQDNIRDKSLKEAMNSQFFREIRKRQPYNDNLYLPCMWIDNPEVSRELYQKLPIQPTHPGADDILRREDLRRAIDSYCARVREAYRPIWEKEQYEFDNFYQIKETVLRLFAA